VGLNAVEDERVYIILVNFHEWEETVTCVESILNSSHKKLQIIIVDNASANESTNKICEWLSGKHAHYSNLDGLELGFEFANYAKPIVYRVLAERDVSNASAIPDPVVLIQAETNRGFSAGNNIGLRYALTQNEANFIWIVNNDTVVLPTTLETLLLNYQELIASGNKVGLLGLKLRYLDDPSVIQGIGGKFEKLRASARAIGMYEEDNGQYDGSTIEVDYPIGAAMLVHRDFVQDIGLMCEDYFLYYEELDWSMRGKDRGWKMYSCCDASIFHKQGASTHTGSRRSSSEKNLTIERYKYTSLLTFYRKYYPRLIFIAYLRLLVVSFKKMTTGAVKEGVMILEIIICR
jgi:GT2 family glycosyltransferase